MIGLTKSEPSEDSCMFHKEMPLTERNVVRANMPFMRAKAPYMLEAFSSVKSSKNGATRDSHVSNALARLP